MTAAYDDGLESQGMIGFALDFQGKLRTLVMVSTTDEQESRLTKRENFPWKEMEKL